MKYQYYEKEDLWIDNEEKEILDLIEKENFKRVKNIVKEKEKLKTAAENFVKKKAVISIRISTSDILKLKRKSIETGIPYQTLIAAVLHQYANDKIKIEI